MSTLFVFEIKVAPGGVLAGHDFTPAHPPLLAAVWKKSCPKNRVFWKKIIIRCMRPCYGRVSVGHGGSPRGQQGRDERRAKNRFLSQTDSIECRFFGHRQHFSRCKRFAKKMRCGGGRPWSWFVDISYNRTVNCGARCERPKNLTPSW